MRTSHNMPNARNQGGELMKRTFFKCPMCNSIISSNQWNAQTADILDMELRDIELLPTGFGDADNFYYCPTCNHYIKGNELKEV